MGIFGAPTHALRSLAVAAADLLLFALRLLLLLPLRPMTPIRALLTPLATFLYSRLLPLHMYAAEHNNVISIPAGQLCSTCQQRAFIV